MTLFDTRNGYYDHDGQWQRTKYCFTDCGSRCDCGPPFGQHYNIATDTRLQRAAAHVSGPIRVL